MERFDGSLDISRAASALRSVNKSSSSAKPRKRKSRAITKPPIKELLADKSSFRDLVQDFTGSKMAAAPSTYSGGSGLLLRDDRKRPTTALLQESVSTITTTTTPAQPAGPLYAAALAHALARSLRNLHAALTAHASSIHSSPPIVNALGSLLRSLEDESSAMYMEPISTRQWAREDVSLAPFASTPW